MSDILKKLLGLLAGSDAVSYADYKRTLRGDGTILVDVRGRDEFAESRLPEAVNIPLDELPGRLGEIPKDKQIATMCLHGVRSAKAAKMLKAKGYNVVSVAGGMSAVPEKDKK